MTTNQKLPIESAVETLTRSERGTKAAKHFLAMLDDGGMSLDANNWDAILRLTMACASDRKGEVAETLAEHLDA